MGERPIANDSPTPDSGRIEKATIQKIVADARSIPLSNGSIDLIITSPPYWRKRDYGIDQQIGQESTPHEYVASLVECLNEWRRLLSDWGSVFINIGDTYHNGNLSSIPGRLEIAARDCGWTLRNRIIWAKSGGMPDPARDRLKNRHEFILHFVVRRRGYYYDQFGYATKYGNGTGPSDVWDIGLRRNIASHLAPFPEELVERAITLACPFFVCSNCGNPIRRIVERTTELDLTRPQARRAKQLANQACLTKDHIAAIQATGISDAGKALKTQNGTGRNSERVQELAAEAKRALGGYFREFTFAKKRTAGWTDCTCAEKYRPGIVLDPFAGTGTTLRVAAEQGRSAIGVDLLPDHQNWSES